MSTAKVVQHTLYTSPYKGGVHRVCFPIFKFAHVLIVALPPRHMRHEP
jgi:hypothetical protein